MRRVLHVVSSMNRGGIETFIMNIYRKIDRNKIQFDFLVHTWDECAYDQEIHSLGGKIHRVSSRKQGVINNRNDLNNFFMEHCEYKIVHQHLSSLTYIEPLKFAKKHGVPMRIVHSHNTKQGGNLIHQYLHKFNQNFIRNIATHYFSCSHLAAKWLYPKKQYERRCYRVINNAIDTEKFIYDENIRNKKRNEFNIKDNFVLGHVGRFTHQKNHDYLIDIFQTIHDQNKYAVLLLIGEGNLRDAIESKVNKLGLQGNVILTGVRSDIPELLQAMDVFVMPSHHEGLPVTVIEAQASGLPCVLSSNITKEIEITNIIRWCGLSQNVGVWKNEILSFKDHNRSEVKEKEIIGAGYDAGVVAKELENVYLAECPG